MARDAFEAYMTPALLRQLEIRLLDLAYYRNLETLEPPITKESLSELDLARFIDDPKLRHDINFERDITFKPNSERQQEKKDRAQMYWEALIIEFFLYSHRQRHLRTQKSDSRSHTASTVLLTDLAELRRVAVRLPHTFVAIREILRTLVPATEWAAIDDHIDVELLIQELENGVCNIRGLADWLGDLLLRSCSPYRDNMVKKMVALIHKGVDDDDSGLLVRGLKELFGVLETMKLVSSPNSVARAQKLTLWQDVANHQIRYLRLLMIDDTVHFEQKTFLQKIADGWHFRDARSWLELEYPLEQSCLPNVVQALIGIVTDDKPRNPWPSTLTCDIDRLMVLKMELHGLLYRRACFQACDATVRALGRQTPLPPESYDRLWNRIEAVLEIEITGKTLAISNKAPSLEIVREACRVCNVATLPADDIIRFADEHIYLCMDSQSRDSQRHRDQLGDQLDRLVDAEIQHLVQLAPVQMVNYISQPPRDQGSDEEIKRLKSIARRLAHISILHWKVWAPILYDQPEALVQNATSLSRTMSALSLAETASGQSQDDTDAQKPWLCTAGSDDSLDMSSSTNASSIGSTETFNSKSDSSESNEPSDDSTQSPA